MAGIASSQLLRLRRKPQEVIDLPFREQIQRVDRRVGAGHPANVLGGVEPDMSSHQGQQIGWTRLEADAFALQLANASDAFLGQQFVTAAMRAGEHDDRRAGVDRLDMIERETATEIELATPKRRRLGT